MKKLLLLTLVAGAFSMTSCRKNYTCSCTGSVSQDYPFIKQTKKDATTACGLIASNNPGTTCVLK